MKGLVIRFKRRNSKNSKKSKKHLKRGRKTRRAMRGGNYYEGGVVVRPLDPQEEIDGVVQVPRSMSITGKIDES